MRLMRRVAERVVRAGKVLLVPGGWRCVYIEDETFLPRRAVEVARMTLYLASPAGKPMEFCGTEDEGLIG